MAQWKSLSLALFVHICDQPAFRIKQDLCMILEIYLNYLIAKAEHNCMLGAHPFFNINMRVHSQVFIG
jgi:hypothetical protein